MARRSPRNTPATQPATRGATDVTAAAVLEAPPAAALEAPPADDPEADVARASAAISLVANRLAEAQANVAEMRRTVGEAAFLAEVDPSSRPALLELRARLAAAESRVDELTAAEAVGRDMAAEAQRRVLEARRNSDWSAAADLLADATVTAQSLDSLLRSAGDLYSQLQRLMASAAARVGRHLSRPEHNIPLPDIDDTLRLVLSNAGGPQAGPTLHLDAAERARATIAHVIEIHGRQVMARRPTSTIEQEPSHGA
jgi:hypothetical protein